MKIEDLYRIFLEHTKISTDSRKIENGVIYFALKGDRFDGNIFTQQALQDGAAYAIIDNPDFFIDYRTILVDDVLSTLQKLANYHRRTLGIPVLAITGTNGKTTTKELVRSVLSRKFSVLSTAGNLNNHIGVPLTLLSITPQHNFAIIEMGANHPMEIDQLCKIVEPDYGIITNIGKAHLEGFGGFEGVIKTKNELFDYLNLNKGIAFYNYENHILSRLLEKTNITRISFGNHSDCLCNGFVTAADPFVSIEVFMKKDITPLCIKTNLIGSYNLENILAAVTIGMYFNVLSEDIKQSIESYNPSNNRSQLTKTQSNTLLLDCYNANPSSTEVALKNLQQIPGIKKMAILGDMLELGDEAEKEHRNILEALSGMGILAILVGPIFLKLSAEFGIMAFLDSESLYVWLKQNPVSDYIILLKGSRGIKLEKVIELL